MIQPYNDNTMMIIQLQYNTGIVQNYESWFIWSTDLWWFVIRDDKLLLFNDIKPCVNVNYIIYIISYHSYHSLSHHKSFYLSHNHRIISYQIILPYHKWHRIWYHMPHNISLNHIPHIKSKAKTRLISYQIPNI